jgi:hypothetical protein
MAGFAFFETAQRRRPCLGLRTVVRRGGRIVDSLRRLA